MKSGAISSPPPPPPPPPPSAGQHNNKKVWIKDAQDVWIIAESEEEIKGNESEIEVSVKGRSEKLSAAEIHLPNPSASDDMTALRYLHEPGILENLQLRYKEKKIYTFMAAALIAVNPLQHIPHPSMEDFRNGAGSNAPHPYAIAETCYKNLLVLGKNQSVVINGESGAGKTETAKIVVKYLAERNRASRSELQSAVTGDELYEKLSGVSPILESFGNAKTGRNSNSSRFGKFMKLNFLMNQASKRQKSMTLIGATIETYLLEKSRVVHQGDGERNFHIFYALLHDVPREMLDNLDLRAAAEGFRIARGFQNNRNQDILEDSHSLQSVTLALQTIGMTSQQIAELWRLLGGLLYLGNIVIEERDSPEGPIAMIHTNHEAVIRCAKLLGVSVEQVRDVLTLREVIARGEKFQVPLTLREAGFTRDATAKAIYEAAFAYIVRQINVSLSSSLQGADPNAVNNFIGVLDIFGFESFAKNGFEQLLINFANEALQNTFNRQIFEKEVALFEEQKIDFALGDCPSNKLCVDLISLKNESIFSTLDAISRQPQPSDERFCEELHKLFLKKNAFFGQVHRKDMKVNFVIQHYAGEVRYSVAQGEDKENSWIIKNNDSTPDALEHLYAESSNSILHSFALSTPSSTSSAAPRTQGGAKRRTSVMMKPTIVATFSRSMDDLNTLLDATLCHFIRCIKPNAFMQVNNFDRKYVIEQVRSLGILSACAILQVSLPTRIPYQELKQAFSSMVQRVQSLFPVQNDVLLISSLFRAYGIPAGKSTLPPFFSFIRFRIECDVHVSMQICIGWVPLLPSFALANCRHWSNC